MKNLPLSVQIWLVFAAITLCISLLLSILFPWALRDFFTKEIYSTIESAQTQHLSRYSHDSSSESWRQNILHPNRRQHHQNMRTVDHILIIRDTNEVFAPRLPIDFIERVLAQANTQNADSARYSHIIGDRKMFYVISKEVFAGKNVLLISYMWDTYREDLVQTLLKKLVPITFLSFLLSWIPSLALARYLSKPLVLLEKKVERLAHRDWQEPILLQREDEIGRLGQSIEQLRNQLLLQDEAQQSFLQHISHELKTPVMVIRSYTQAISDGIYPKGSISDSVQVIDEEAARLEKRIRNLLYLTKLDYLATHAPSRQLIPLAQLVQDAVDRFRWQRGDLEWSLDISTLNIYGDLEQWSICMENLLDNQVRYARSNIIISLQPSQESNAAILHIWNDGPSIEDSTSETLFNKFNKGYKGEFGLGLAIVYRIVNLHQAEIRAENQNHGVSFYLTIPLA